jgi:hypothetical protein
MLITEFSHKFDRMAGVEEKTPLEMLQCMASRGEPNAIELLQTIPHHRGKAGRNLAEETAINAQIKDTITRIFVAADIEINFSMSPR